MRDGKQRQAKKDPKQETMPPKIILPLSPSSAPTGEIPLPIIRVATKACAKSVVG